jgi:ABC-2 type transport system ATP-binding protein
MTVMSIAVRADSLSKHFKTVRALSSVSFEVPTGTVLGLLGPNGAGKTTAVRILTTVLKPDGGHAVVAGHDVVTDPQAVRRSIGLAGQYAAVDENLTGRENLTLIGRLNHLRKSAAGARAAELLTQFNLDEAADRTVRTYSGGMRRRLDLGAALVTHPSVLLLDEPTTGLDPSGRADLWDVIQQLVSDGTSVLLTTQYLEEADRLADRIVVIDHGSVVAEGTASDLKRRIGGTTLVLTFANESTAVAAAQSLAAESVTVLDNSVSLPLRGGAAAVRNVLNHLHDHNIQVERIDLREPSLDDVFLTLTGGTK